MTPLSEHKDAERDAIARATAEFLSDGGEIQKLGSRLGPIKNLTWRGESNAIWKAKIRGDLPVKAPPRPKPVKRAKVVPQDSIDRMHAAKSAKCRAERDAMAPAVRELAALDFGRNRIAEALDIAPPTVARIAKEHDIQLPLYPRKGTKQARKNAELREDW